MSALGDGERIFEEIRAVEELRMVGRDTVIVCSPLPVRGNVCRGGGECRKEKRRLANICRSVPKFYLMSCVSQTRQQQTRNLLALDRYFSEKGSGGSPGRPVCENQNHMNGALLPMRSMLAHGDVLATKECH